MNRNREAVFMGIGILAGLALSGPAAQAATAALTASPTSQTFYVDGRKVEFEAYSIHGNNFVKLRDIGRAVDFGVTYDATTNSVYIDPDAHYEQEASTPAQTMIFSSASITEESVQAVLEQLKQTYPTGTVFPTPYRSTSNGPYSRGIHCSGWATLCSDAAFGDLPWRRIDRPSWEQLRPGDIVEYENEKSYHAVVVIRKNAEYIVVTESGMNNHAVWGGQYFRWWLEQQSGYICYTRYPQ